MEFFTILLLLSPIACFAGNDTVTDPIIINGSTVTDAPVTEVDPVPPKPTTTTPEPKPTTLPPITSTNPSNITTTSSTTTTKPTTPTPKPITSTLSTTLSPPTNGTTTPTPPPSPNSTAAPITTTASPDHGRKFDGTSFIGGILLALGLVAIGFMGYKFYKARSEMNYHTL